jgi:hypothetical protein
MTNIFIVFAVGITGVVVAAAAFWHRSTQSAENLGSVSHQWIAELRAGEPYDSSR